MATQAQRPVSLDDLDEESRIEPARPSPGGGEAASQPPPPAPEVESDGDDTADAPEAAEEPEAPAGLKDGFRMLAQAEALPERNRREKADKERRLDFLRRRMAAMQQGLPSIALAADDLALSQEKERKQVKRHRLELLARQSPEIAELLAERDRLSVEVEKLKAG